MKPSVETIQPDLDVSFSLKKKNDPFIFHWHYHIAEEIVLITDGEGECFIGSSITSFSSPSVIVIGKGVSHAFNSLYPNNGNIYNKAFIIHLPGQLFSNGHLTRPEYRSIRDLFTSAQSGLFFGEKTAREMESILCNLYYENPLHKWIDILEILDLLVDTDDRETPFNIFPPKDDTHFNPPMERIYSVCQYIYNHATDNISLSEIAVKFNMSIPTLCRYFKKFVGLTFKQYLIAVRLKNAGELLLQTEYPINYVRYKSGFRNEANFIRQFTRYHRYSPREYRKKIKGLTEKD